MSFSLFRASLPAALLTVGITLTAYGQPPTNEQLMEEIRQLRSEVAQLKAATRPASDADVIQMRQDVLRDASQRSHPVATGIQQLTAGVEKNKFFLRDAKGDFSLSPTLQMQLRNVTNWSDGDDEDNLENGFEIRRAKFGFEGTAFTKDLGYKFVWATNRAGGSVFLEDAIVTYKLNDTWSVFGGQFKDPIHHEELVSSSRQLAVERSLVNELVGGGLTDRVQGIGMGYKAGPISASVVFHDGVNSDNTHFRDSPFNATDYGVGGRLEYTAFGDNKQYGDFTARKNKSDLLVLGLGGEVTGASSSNRYFYTADAQWENTRGTGVYVAAIATTRDGHGAGGDSTTDWGGLAQVGQMLTDKWELFGRLGHAKLDDDATHDGLWEITIGANYYLFDHNAKLTLDLIYLPDGSPADSGLGYFDSGGADQVVARVQFQLTL